MLRGHDDHETHRCVEGEASSLALRNGQNTNQLRERREEGFQGRAASGSAQTCSSQTRACTGEVIEKGRDSSVEVRVLEAG